MCHSLRLLVLLADFRKHECVLALPYLFGVCRVFEGQVSGQGRLGPCALHRTLPGVVLHHVRALLLKLFLRPFCHVCILHIHLELLIVRGVGRSLSSQHCRAVMRSSLRTRRGAVVRVRAKHYLGKGQRLNYINALFLCNIYDTQIFFNSKKLIRNFAFA